jgi:hypothetical protein
LLRHGCASRLCAPRNDGLRCGLGVPGIEVLMLNLTDCFLAAMHQSYAFLAMTVFDMWAGVPGIEVLMMSSTDCFVIVPPPRNDGLRCGVGVLILRYNHWYHNIDYAVHNHKNKKASTFVEAF